MPNTSTRQYDLDWLRIIALGLLVLYHVGMYYVSWDWHIKSAHASTTIEPLMMLTSPWRLSLLFAVSGVAIALFLERRTPGAMVKERAARLLPPLAFAIYVVVPPQSYFEVSQKTGQSLSYLEFWGKYLQGYSGFCKGQDCLSLPTGNHMWFVAYLWVYAMILALTLHLLPKRLQTAQQWSARTFCGWRVIVIPILWIAAVRILMLTRFPSTHDLFNDWFNHATYLSLFAFGAMVLSVDAVRAEIARMRWIALGLAILSYCFLAPYYAYYVDIVPPDWLRYTQRLIWATNQWCAVLAAFGFAYRLLKIDNRARRYLAAAIFPVYLFHQTAIIVIAAWIAPYKIHPLFESALLVTGTLIVCFALYEIALRIPVLCILIGAQQSKPSQAT